MKATSIHRLYVTQPAAYLQDSESFDSGWAWQEVRELGRYPPQPPAVGDDPTAAVKEDCWEWNGRLDEVPTPSSSVSLSTRQPQQRLPKHSPSPTPDFFTGKEYPSMSSLSRSGQGQVARKAPARPAHLRTASVPPVAAEMMSPALRRRVTASVFERKSSPMPRPMALAVAKRRQTRSPNIWQRNTPRWSTSSPSPAIDIARGVTPGVQYYATPFSNGTYEPRRGVPGDHHDADDEDRGSATDPYDECSEMTQPEDGNVSEWRQPEDDPWPGLPDHPMSDSENVDPLSTAPSGAEDEGGDHGMEDVGSEASSQPSEYPSTQSVWQGNGVAGDFRIHEDEEDDGMGAMQS